MNREIRRLGGKGEVFLLIALISCGFSVSCGYHAVYGGDATERLHVRLMRSLVPDAVASDEVAAGLREELARAGALDAGEGYPRIEVEVLRSDEASGGIAAGAAGPVARATDVGITGRAWIVRSPGAPPERDTGDFRAQEVMAVDEAGFATPDARASAFHHADALRAAARRLGRALGRRVLGEPAASEDVSEMR